MSAGGGSVSIPVAIYSWRVVNRGPIIKRKGCLQRDFSSKILRKLRLLTLPVAGPKRYILTQEATRSIFKTIKFMYIGDGMDVDGQSAAYLEG